ncbi:MAG: hypothetical protein WCS09_18695, partial [Pseudomonadota bacterium]
MRLLQGELGKRPEQRELVGRHLAVAIEDPFDLVGCSHRSASAQLEQQRVPPRARTRECILGIPPSDLLEPDALEQQLQV